MSKDGAETAQKPLTGNERLHRALRSIMDEAKQKGDGVVFRKDRPTWNPKAHIELTLCAEDIWAIQDALTVLDLAASTNGSGVRQ